ncbi:MAG TPA: hypothetical protein VFG23_19980 [Polyangia bacterium]|nr:hypothetical protein [Polyangia bacterium]
MSTDQPPRTRDGCPHCGKSVGLSWWTLLPSSDRRRRLKCQACGGQYDLSDTTKVAGMMAGIMGMGVAVLLFFGRIVKAGHGAKPYVAAATLVVALSFFLPAVIMARVALRLEAKR